MVVRATESGAVTTELSNGRSVTDTVEVPASYDITDWDLTVQSWRPNPTPGDLVRTETIDGLTTVNRQTATVTTPIEVELDTLTTWDEIPAVGKGVSGTGHYEATFEWDAEAASGAYLDLGDTLQESMSVTVNGRKVGGHDSTNPTKVRRDVGGVGRSTIDDGTGTQVPLVGQPIDSGGISWSRPVADVSDYLVDGVNTIEIEYSSALSNVQLDRGAATPMQNVNNWWKNNFEYLSFGPERARLVPFVDVAYGAGADTQVTAAPARGTYGRPTTVVVTVAGEQPSGTVTLADGGRTLGTSPVAGGRARFTLGRTALPAGARSLVASYSGDERNAASSGTVAVRIAKARASIRATGARVKPGRRATTRVNVTAPGVRPSGTVVVRKAGRVLARGTLGAAGKATLRLARLGVGDHRVTVAYRGTRNLTTATTTVTVTVRRR